MEIPEKPDGREVGFKILEFSRFDPETSDLGELWDGPRFDAPVLGLTGSSAGETVLAAGKLFKTRTINRVYLNSASGGHPREALALWIACLHTGDSMAHFGLGCTLYELGRRAIDLEAEGEEETDARELLAALTDIP